MWFADVLSALVQCVGVTVLAPSKDPEPIVQLLAELVVNAYLINSGLPTPYKVNVATETRRAKGKRPW